MNWYQLDALEAVRQLKTDPASGLSEAEGACRLAEHGRNELAGTDVKSPWLILWEQLTALMVVILIVAAIVSALLGDVGDAIAISVIVLLNAALGTTQEYRAEQAMAALRKLAVPAVKVRRGSGIISIPAVQLVPGDIVLLEAGNAVAADCRILESFALEIHEAALTGESTPILKLSAALSQSDVALGDRLNMAYMGTFVTGGRGVAVVTETGMQTELGRIASLIQGVRRELTPLQRRLDGLGRGLAGIALGLVGVISLLGYLRGEEPRLLFLTAVSMAVAAVPEGLPAVVTIALALGAQRMLKRRVLIRKLPAVETLGCVTVICSDKTGTLTQNRMKAVVIETAHGGLDLEGDDALGDSGGGAFSLLLAAGALCNDASSDLQGKNSVLGDPTETALVVAAARFNLRKSDLEILLPRHGELPFSSDRKRMTTIHRLPDDPALTPFIPVGELAGSSFIAFTKGACDELLEISSRVWLHGRADALTPVRREALREQHHALAERGMRILGLAFRLLPESWAEPDSAVEKELTFLGMVGIADPARPEVAEAVEKCISAGIRPVMITGDHPLTARTIASQLGISSTGEVLTGRELDKLSASELAHHVRSVPVFARVSPEHKLKIVDAMQRGNHIVAMTGDGVNDAPALKKADIGVAMGVTGTDVAKEAADIVLLDDNFAAIVDAVEEGRVIYDNIRKFVRYILATNAGEIWLMLVAPMLGMPMPLLPLQILWMNLVTDGLPALALGVEAAEPHTMRRPPHRPDESIFGRGLGVHVAWVGLLMGLVALVPAYLRWKAEDPNWQTLLFTTITLSQMAHVLAIRSEKFSLFQIGLTTNEPLLAAVSLTFVLQLALLYVAPLQSLLRTRPLPGSDLALSLALSCVTFAAVEAEKWMLRRKSTNAASGEARSKAMNQPKP